MWRRSRPRSPRFSSARSGRIARRTRSRIRLQRNGSGRRAGAKTPRTTRSAAWRSRRRPVDARSSRVDRPSGQDRRQKRRQHELGWPTGARDGRMGRPVVRVALAERGAPADGIGRKDRSMSAPILDDRPALDPDPLRATIREAYRADEAECVARLLEAAALADDRRGRVQGRARNLAQRVRDARGDRLGIEAFLHEYGLSTPEGVMLMCLAEALLRIPDAETADRLIRDKLGAGDWAGHLGRSGSLLVNASTWGLMLTGRFVRVDLDEERVASGFTRLVHRLGEPVVRTALLQAMRVLGQHFVLGQTIEQAIVRADEAEGRGYRYSYDMLGEAARTMADAGRYHESYGHAIDAIVATARGDALMARPSISIKLSALHPRYELAQQGRLPRELLPRLIELAGRARAGNIAVTIDAEEADRLEPSLDLFEQLLRLPDFAGWDGLGLAVPAYQKRAI